MVVLGGGGGSYEQGIPIIITTRQEDAPQQCRAPRDDVGATALSRKWPVASTLIRYWLPSAIEAGVLRRVSSISSSPCNNHRSAGRSSPASAGRCSPAVAASSSPFSSVIPCWSLWGRGGGVQLGEGRHVLGRPTRWSSRVSFPLNVRV